MHPRLFYFSLVYARHILNYYKLIYEFNLQTEELNFRFNGIIHCHDQLT